jgi:glycosyltransferase involved in cell wall biosynthesis
MATSGVSTSARSDATAALGPAGVTGSLSHRIDLSHASQQLDAQSVAESAATASAKPRFKTSCLINNYNYARYVSEAVESALAQSVAFDEIIVVDDGSTDESVELLTRCYRAEPRLRIITKQNGGQLSSFNEGFLQSSGDILFFLDADDIYEPAYLETMLRLYAERPEVDFAFCALRLFGAEEGEQYRFPTSTDFGYTMALTYFAMPWIGNATSCISARRPLLARFLPLPNTHDWRIRADDCLVFGAGMAGGRKYFLHDCLIRYRVHGNNGFYGRGLDEVCDYPRLMTLQRLRGVLAEQLGLRNDMVAAQIAAEFRHLPRPQWNQLRQYSKLLGRATACRDTRRRILVEMLDHYRTSSSGSRNLRDELRLLTTRLRWRSVA